MKSFLIAQATLLFLMSLNSASVLAAQINLSNITTTNAVKTNDAILVNANLGGGVWATRTATKQAVFGDPFKVTSLLADNATNVAMVVNASSGWPYEASLFAGQNEGTNAIRINSLGSLALGKSAESGSFYGTMSSNHVIQAYRSPVFGDPGEAIIQMGVIEDETWVTGNEATLSSSLLNGTYLSLTAYQNTVNSGSWSLTAKADRTSEFYFIDALSAKPINLTPDANDALTPKTAVTLGSSYALTNSGSAIAAFHHAGTNKVVILPNGAVQTGGNTNQWVFKGKITGATVALTTTNYLEIVLNGVTNKVALVQ